jgi:hypothetical protein
VLGLDPVPRHRVGAGHLSHHKPALHAE